jgi:hypothetical protein
LIGKFLYVSLFGMALFTIGILILQRQWPVGPLVLGATVIPLLGLSFARRSFKRAIPDVVFGTLDTGLLVVPALWGGMLFGVAGAVVGGVIGDALTDGVAGFAEGGIAEWLRDHGIEESREPITTALGKMTGCLLGSGITLSVALLLGVEPAFRS